MKIQLDINNRCGKLNTPWNFGINTCHAILWKRKDLMNHAVLASENCGFKYVRFHNIISKHLNVYTEDENGNPVIDFTIFDEIFDNVAKCGYIPFFEVGFCPDALSRHTRDLCFYEADPSIPLCFDKWSYLIREITKHCLDRYGLEYVKQWYFEVWNEPDLFYDGTMEDYFELYDYTVTAIKEVNSSLRVGGPATSKCLWVEDFIKHVEKGSQVTSGKPVPCDFISTHAYPSDLAFLDSDYGDVELQQSDVMFNLYSHVKELVDNSSLKGVPIFMGEWNSSAGPFAENHDEKNNCAYVIKILHDVKDIIDGSLYWNLSDIYEEQGFHYIPFHGGYGIFNINDIPKSSYHAFEMLNKLSGEEISIDILEGRARALAAIDESKNNINVLLYYYCEPEDVDLKAEKIELNLSGINSETLRVKSSAVTDNSGSAYEWWQKVGSPQFINSETLNMLLEKSKPEISSGVLRRGNNAEFKLETELEPGDSMLISFNY